MSDNPFAAPGVARPPLAHPLPTYDVLLAGRGSRFVARIIDRLLMIGVPMLVFCFSGLAVGDSAAESDLALVSALLLGALVLFGVLLLVTYVPAISLTLVDIFYK